MYSLMEECRMNAEYEAECKRRYELHDDLVLGLESALRFIDGQAHVQRKRIQSELRSVIAKARGTI